MASSSVSVPPGKFEFLVVVHDKPNAREKRLEVRGTHFKNMTPHVEDGSWKMGGAILNSVPKDDSPSSLDFAGSTLVCVAESAEEVREQLNKDIYATSGVWDMDKVQIYPFKAAFRTN
ncbi:Ff.00g068630.m01.CDS01 [Fusarium sp. VM40]|nr:Ff.00g068630.m01.CDS01 [Fusarium sp. VM40]